MREERHDGDSGRHQDVSGRIAEIRQELLQRELGFICVGLDACVMCCMSCIIFVLLMTGPSGARMGSAESLVAAVYDDGTLKFFVVG